MVQWLGLHALITDGQGSIPGQGTKILQAVRHEREKNIYISKSQPVTVLGAGDSP